MNFIFYYRYATVLYYLNDVKYGGETAFPVVDENTFDKQVGLQSQCNPDFSNLPSIMHSNQTSHGFSPLSTISNFNPYFMNYPIIQNNFRSPWRFDKAGNMHSILS